LDLEFRKIQFSRDLTITETLPNQTIDWAQYSHLFPKDTHTVNLRFFEAVSFVMGSGLGFDGHLPTPVAKSLTIVHE
jgi:hypothetical protein